MDTPNPVLCQSLNMQAILADMLLPGVCRLKSGTMRLCGTEDHFCTTASHVMFAYWLYFAELCLPCVVFISPP
jgi:hypothetical protein